MLVSVKKQQTLFLPALYLLFDSRHRYMIRYSTIRSSNQNVTYGFEEYLECQSAYRHRKKPETPTHILSTKEVKINN